MTGWEKSAVSLAVFLPAAGAAVVAMVPSRQDRLIRGLGILFTGAALAIGIVMLFGFDFGRSGLQFELNASWISTIHARFHVGIDGISLPLFELTLLLSFLCAIYTFKVLPSPGRPKAFLALMMLLETGMAGTFIAFDLILFFVFWELVLVPMYFLIALWGSANREYASIKFFLYTLFGSALMIVSFLALYFLAPVSIDGQVVHTFDMQLLSVGARTLSTTAGILIFGGMFMGFGIKVPIFPFHTWLPDAHTQAPTVGSVILAAVLLKLGTYGFVRIAVPILPVAARTWAPYIGALAVIGIIYGALCCLAQTDMKRLIAFSSVAHMGYVMLGIASLTTFGINAAVFGMVAHGLITGMLFFLAGSVKERYHTLEIKRLGGMLTSMPHLGWILGITTMASLGLPGLAGFWGEFPAILSAWQANVANVGLFRGYMVVAAIGTVLAAGYLLWLYQRAAFGTPPEEFANDSHLHDVTVLEWVAWLPMLVGIVVLGFFPNLIFKVTDPAVITHVISHVVPVGD